MKPANAERKFVFLFAGAVLLVIVAASLLAPPSDDSDKSPTTYNSGTNGVKAAYLLLGDLGYSTARWDQPPSALTDEDAPTTTIIYANPDVPADKYAEVRADIAAFLQRGGHVLITGPEGASLLPGGSSAQPTQPFDRLCITTPEGRGPLARAGKVSINDNARWTAMSPAVHVEQWCGGDAVVVSYHVGPGTAIWWSSALPLTNLGLKNDPSLKLLLATVDTLASSSNQPRPTVLFDAYFHTIQTSLSDYTRGLPLAQIGWQTAAVALLLVLSYSRRSGPIRLLTRLPRTSPIEFAESMGQLYRKAGATQAATSSARRRLLGFLHDRCGVPRTVAQSNSSEIADALSARYPGDWTSLADHLAQAANAEYQQLTPRGALALVKALDQDLQTLTKLTNHPRHS